MKYYSDYKGFLFTAISCLFLVCSSPAFAQTIKLTGTVEDNRRWVKANARRFNIDTCFPKR